MKTKYPLILIRFILTIVVIKAGFIPLAHANSNEERPAPQAVERSLIRPWTWFRGNPTGDNARQRAEQETRQSGNEEAQQRGRERGETEAQRGRERGETEAQRGRERGETEAQRGRERGFSAQERERMENLPESSLPPGLQHRQQAGRGLPPGLQRRVDRGEGLPPGWANRVEVGKPLPEDIYKNATAIPPQLKKQLPAAPEGVQDILVEDQIIRVVEQTREVIDSLRIGRRTQ